MALFGLVAIVLLAISAHRPPFRFLDGHDPLPVSADRRTGNLGYDDELIYSFQGSYADLVAAAKKELLALGFVIEAHPHADCMFHRTMGSEDVSIDIMKDLRMTQVSTREVNRWLSSYPG